MARLARGKAGTASGPARVAFPWLLEGLGPDGKPIGGTGQHLGKAPQEEFNRRYSDGIKLLEKEDLGEAMKVFEDIVKTYPGSDEASMAAYRIAQIHFKNKANQLAYDTYKKILNDYPNSPVVENAKAAIQYLDDFQKHEENYVSPDVDDKHRRGH